MSVLHHIAHFFSAPRPGQTLLIPAGLRVRSARTDFTARFDLPREKQLQWWAGEVGLIVTTRYVNDEPFEFLVCENPRPAAEPHPVEPSADRALFIVCQIPRGLSPCPPLCPAHLRQR